MRQPSRTLSVRARVESLERRSLLSGLSGTNIALNDDRLIFNDVAGNGTASAAQTVTLKNTGTGTLTIASFTTTGDYAQTNTCGTSLAPGASCTIKVTFTPTAKGTRTGTLTVTSNAAGSPHKVSLTGNGN